VNPPDPLSSVATSVEIEEGGRIGKTTRQTLGK